MKKKVSYAVAIIFAVICMSFAFSANAAQKELNSDTANVTLKTTSYIYYNNEKEPKPTVTYTENDSTVTLKNGTDYTLSYENNKNVGTATVTVTGIGDYTGSISADFTIEKYDLSQHTDTVSVSLSYTSCTYDGTAKKPTVTVKCPFNNTKETIVSGTDYTVKYSNNVNAGTAKVVITGKGNFKGSIEKTFKINKASLSSSGKTVASLKYTSVTYTSKSLKPSTTVYYYLTSNKKTKLTKDKDYTVTYSNNKNIGTATVKIKGTGNYTGSVKKTFKIIPKTVSGVKISNRTTSSFVVSWSKVSGVTGYQIYKYDSSSKSYKKYKTVKAGTTSVKISDLSSSKAYKIKVRAYKKVDDKTYYGKYSSKKTGVTNPKKVTITSVSKSGTTLSVKWNKVSCSGYEVIYTTDKNFKTGLKTKTISKSSTTSTSIKNLSKSKHYYVKVRAYYTYNDKKYYGSKSDKLSSNYSHVYATYSSNYVSNANRTNNLRIASAAINGTIIAPGETFSFNQVVGKRTTAKGYKAASVFSGGGVVNGIGGGVCQVASTMFNCALKANVTITERHQHSQRVSYVPLGRDAAIYWGSEDFKWTNNTKYPIMIAMSVKDGVITCTFKTCQNVNPKKVKLNVTQSGSTFKLTRTVDGKVNYTTRSYY